MKNVKKIFYVLIIFTLIFSLLAPLSYGALTEIEQNSENIQEETEKEQENTVEENIESHEEDAEVGTKDDKISPDGATEPSSNSDEDENKKENETMTKMFDINAQEKVQSSAETNTIKESSQTIEDGIYKINTKLNSNKYLDISAGSKQNGANVQIWDKSDVDQQKFLLTYLNNGSYKIEAVHSQKVLDVYGGYKTNGTNVWQYEFNGSNAQSWIIKDLGNGYYSIISKCNGLYLDISGGYSQNGTNVQVYEGNGSSAQQFKFEEVGIKGEKTIEDGIYKINTKLNLNKYIDISAGSKENGANVQIWDNSEVDQQKFQITYLNNGFYKIEAFHSKKALDVAGGGKSNGTNVWQYESNGSDAQSWVIKNSGNGYYNIISKCNSLYLDVSSGSSNNGTNIQVYEGNNSSAQQFKFEEVEELKGEKTVEDGTYKIKLSTTYNMVLSVANRSKDNRANIELRQDSEYRSQKFQVTYLDNGFYKIAIADTGKVLDVAGGEKASGTNVWQYDYNGSDAQSWVIKDLGNGYYSIISKCNSLYLDVYGGYTSDGTNIQTYKGNGSSAQQFIFEKTELQAIDTGLYEIQSAKDTSKVIDVAGGSISNDANVQIWERANVNQQKFYFEYDGTNKNYKIAAAHSSKVLDVHNAQAISGTNVKQYESHDVNAQRWKIVDLGDGSYNIISECGDLCLDIYGGYTDNGTNVQIYTPNGTIAQKFNIIETKLSNNSNYASLDESKYPKYKELLNNLQKAHPSWTFRIYYTGIDWNTMLEKENGYNGTSPISLIWDSYGNEWIDGTTKYDVSKRWYKASKKAIAYIMDPRNSLKTDTSIFQFQELASSSGTKEEISKMTKDTFLHTDSIINAIYEAANEQGISPFHIVSRILQEQGTNGGTLNGYSYKDARVYNLFNINVTQSTGIEGGAQYALEKGWYTPEACIKGGTQFLKTNYISRGQSTLYFQRFDTMSNPIVSHQYMQNLTAPYTEGYSMYNSFKSTDLLESHFTFTIPVYENMPSSYCPMPIG